MQPRCGPTTTLRSHISKTVQTVGIGFGALEVGYNDELRCICPSAVVAFLARKVEKIYGDENNFCVKIPKIAEN